MCGVCVCVFVYLCVCVRFPLLKASYWPKGGNSCGITYFEPGVEKVKILKILDLRLDNSYLVEGDRNRNLQALTLSPPGGGG